MLLPNLPSVRPRKEKQHRFNAVVHLGSVDASSTAKSKECDCFPNHSNVGKRLCFHYNECIFEAGATRDCRGCLGTYFEPTGS